MYHEDVAEWYDLVRSKSSSGQRVMLVSHNPTLEEFLESLAGQYTRMPTAALALVELPIDDWSRFQPDVHGNQQGIGSAPQKDEDRNDRNHGAGAPQEPLGNVGPQPPRIDRARPARR